MVDYGVHDGVDLGLGAFDHPGLGVGHPPAVDDDEPRPASVPGGGDHLQDVLVALLAQRLGGELVVLGAEGRKLADREGLGEFGDGRAGVLGPRPADVTHGHDLPAAHEHGDRGGQARRVELVHDDQIGPGHGRNELGGDHRRDDPHGPRDLDEPRVGGDDVPQDPGRVAFELRVQAQRVLAVRRDRLAHGPDHRAVDGDHEGSRVRLVEAADLGGEFGQARRRRAGEDRRAADQLFEDRGGVDELELGLHVGSGHAALREVVEDPAVAAGAELGDEFVRAGKARHRGLVLGQRAHPFEQLPEGHRGEPGAGQHRFEGFELPVGLGGVVAYLGHPVGELRPAALRAVAPPHFALALDGLQVRVEVR